MERKLAVSMFGQKRLSREGGIEIVAKELCTRMVQNGCTVTCYNRSGHHVSGAEYDNKTEYEGICQKYVPTIEKKGLAAVSSSFFAAFYSAFGKYDVVHIHAEGPAFFAWLPKLFGKKVVVTIHGIDWQREKWKSGFGSKFIRQGEKNAVKYADEIIVLSKGVQDYFKNTYDRDTWFIPNGVNRPEIRKAELITQKFGLTENSYILFLGRLVPEKGIRYLIEAFKNVCTDKKLVIAGGSSDTDSFMKELQESAKEDDRIIFTGFVQGRMLDELYSNAYIYTLPSDLEGMPLSLLEAMSYGKAHWALQGMERRIMKTTLLIMAAGIGSRFGTGIKQLEPVDDAGHIIMDYSIHDALEAGFNHVVFIIRKDIEQEFKEVIGERITAICAAHDVTVDYAFQDINDIPGTLPEGRTKPWGTGQAVLAAKKVIKTPFIVINADDYYGKEGFKAVHEYLVNGGKSCMAGFVLKNTLSDNGGVTRGICKMDEDYNLTEVVETKNIVKTVAGAEAEGMAVDVDSLVSMNMWGLTPDFLTTLEEGFKEFFEKEVPGNPLKAEYLIPIFIGELLEHGKMSVKVLKTNDTWYGMTYHEDVAAVKDSFKRMLENGVYKTDLFSDL